MGECIRIPLYSQRKKLLGYWAMRQRGDEYRISFRYPGQKLKTYQTDDPEHAVSIFYRAYVGFLGKKLSEIDNQLAELPNKEYRKRGFRDGWLRKFRSALRRDRCALISEAEKVLADKISNLKKAGWPRPAFPKLPWEEIDGERASGSVYIARGSGDLGSTALPREWSVDITNQEADWAKLSEDTQDIGGKRDRDTSPWVISMGRGGPCVVKVGRDPEGNTRIRADGDDPSFRASEALRLVERAGKADSGKDRGTKRDGDTNSP